MSELPSPNTLIADIKGSLFKQLVSKLTINESWRVIAEKYSKILDERQLEMEKCPSTALLLELHTKRCTVQLVRTLLYRSKLLEAAAVLSEPKPLSIDVQPGNDISDVYVLREDELKLEVQASGVPPPQYVWFRDNEELVDQRMSVLHITNFQPKDEGEYRCCVSQEGADDQYSTSVNVKMIPEQPAILKQPLSISVRVGDEIILTCEAVSHPCPKYEWIHGNLVLNGQNHNILRIEEASLSDCGAYKCCISNGYNEVFTDVAKVSVYDVPVEQIEGTRLRIVEEKMALIIVNVKYTALSQLFTPYNDAKVLSEILTDLGFKVIMLCDLCYLEMVNAVKTYCDLLPEGSYAIVYFAGHGFELNDKYMLPVDCPGPDMYSCLESLSEKHIIREVLKKEPKLLLLVLDMCLKLPDRQKNPSVYCENVEPVPYEAKRNLIQAYATSSYLDAFERVTESNGIYMKHLMRFLSMDVPIERILQEVIRSISEEAGDTIQMPSFTLNIIPNIHYLSVPCRGNRESQKKFFQLTNLHPDSGVLRFLKDNHVASFKLYFYRMCFHNGLEIHISNLGQWTIKCTTTSMELLMFLGREDNVVKLKVLNLQKLKTDSLSISIELKTGDKMVDYAILDINIPIAHAALWFSSAAMMNSSEVESYLDTSCISSQSVCSEEEIQDIEFQGLGSS